MIGNLKTERLLMRPMCVADAPAFYKFYSNPEVMRFIGKGNTVESVEKVRLSIEKHQRTHHHEENLGLWSVFLPATVDTKEVLIGHCGVLYWDIEGVREYEIAYLLGKEFLGQGYATEAACATRDWGFRERKFERMISLIYPENVASQKVAERVGMSYEKDVIVMDRIRVLMYSLQNLNPKFSC